MATIQNRKQYTMSKKKTYKIEVEIGVTTSDINIYRKYWLGWFPVDGWKVSGMGGAVSMAKDIAERAAAKYKIDKQDIIYIE